MSLAAMVLVLNALDESLSKPKSSLEAAGGESRQGEPCNTPVVDNSDGHLLNPPVAGQTADGRTREGAGAAREVSDEEVN